MNHAKKILINKKKWYIVIQNYVECLTHIYVGVFNKPRFVCISQ